MKSTSYNHIIIINIIMMMLCYLQQDGWALPRGGSRFESPTLPPDTHAPNASKTKQEKSQAWLEARGGGGCSGV